MNNNARFTVISYNVRGLKNTTRVNELTMFLTTHKPSVLIIQEPKVDHRTSITKIKTNQQGRTTTTVTPHTPVPLPKFTGYAAIYCQHPTQPTGIVFYIHQSCTYKVLNHVPHATPYRPDITNTTAAFVWISHSLLPQPVVVGGVYLDSKCTQQDVKAFARNIALASQPLPGCPAMSIPLPLFILGDFNARHRSWDPHIEDANQANYPGKLLYEHIVTYNTARRHHARIPPLTLINNMFTNTHKVPTREESGSVIDLALTSHINMVESMHVMSDPRSVISSSDHHPIVVTLKRDNTSSHVPCHAHAPQISAVQEEEKQGQVDMEHKYDEHDEKHGNAEQKRQQPQYLNYTNTHAVQPHYFIRMSTIPGAGYGFFANRRYRKGERIIVYTGEVITETVKKERYPNNDAKYVVYVMHDTYIDARDANISSDARYINSSGGGYNNAAMHPQHSNNTHTINIVATHDIAPGEEVFMPYGSTYHMQRAPRPNKSVKTTPTTHWDQHMRAPNKTRDDGRVRWRINKQVDWKMFTALMEPKIDTWMQTYKPWMPPTTHTEHKQQHNTQHAYAQLIEGTIQVVMYTDGASRGNPGAASCGGVMYFAKDKLTPETDATAQPIHSFSTTLGIATNNEAEYRGLLQGLKAACEMGVTHVHAHVDSQLMCRQIQGRYQVRNSKLMQIYEQCKIHISQLQQFNITHIPRKLNKEADKLCNDALDAWHTWADDIPDMMAGNETGLNDEQKDNITREHEQQQIQQEQDMKEHRHNNNTQRPSHITQEQIDACWTGIHDIMMSAADASIGRVTEKPHSKYWWAVAPDIHAKHNNMTRKKRRKRKLDKILQHRRVAQQQHSITPAQLAGARKEYRGAKKEFNESVLKAKNDEWKGMAGATDTYTDKHRHQIMWKAFKKTKGSTRVAAASFADKDGHPPLDATQALNNMAAHIARISSLPHNAMFDATHEEHVLSYVRDSIPERPISPHAPSFSFSDVEHACTSFRLNTALGADNVSPHFLRNGGKQLHRAIYMLFCICSWYGVVPTAFRHGHVMTLYKGEGQETDPDNYRPITITSVIARIYERVHKNELLNEMIAAGIPSKDQFGFTKQRSTHDAIYRLLSLIVDTSTKGDDDPEPLERYVPAVFVDISKAYDKVWIDGLLYKLHHDLGITGNLFYMIKAMLTKRTIQVVCDGKISSMYVLEEGVAQGSILAPLLFLIYIHDMTQTRGNGTNICMSLFADDISLLPLKHGSAGIAVLNRALDDMSVYAKKWKIIYSPKKTNVVYFKPGFKPERGYVPPHTHGTLKLSNFSIECAQQYKYLGVDLDQCLTFIPYVRDLIKRLAATTHVISRLVRRDHAPSIPVIQTLVKTVLIPKMVYGFAFIPPRFLANKKINLKITGITDTSSSMNLHSALKRAFLTPLMRSMGQPYYVHHDSLLVESRLLSIPSLHSLSCIRLAHRWMSNTLDATNEAGRMFREHTMHPPSNTSGCHPFAHIQLNIMRITALDAFRDTPRSLIDVERHRLKEIVWEQQYKEWTENGSHPLQQHYTVQAPTQRNVPTYTHMDTPGAATNRARLRFARARLKFDQKRMKFRDVGSVTCRQCGKTDETVKHVIETCDAPAVVDIRNRMRKKLRKLCDKYNELIEDVGNVLNPKAKNMKAMKKAHKITGHMISLLRDVWDF